MPVFKKGRKRWTSSSGKFSSCVAGWAFCFQQRIHLKIKVLISWRSRITQQRCRRHLSISWVPHGKTDALIAIVPEISCRFTMSALSFTVLASWRKEWCTVQSAERTSSTYAVHCETRCTTLTRLMPSTIAHHVRRSLYGVMHITTNHDVHGDS